MMEIIKIKEWHILSDYVQNKSRTTNIVKRIPRKIKKKVKNVFIFDNISKLEIVSLIHSSYMFYRRYDRKKYFQTKAKIICVHSRFRSVKIIR